MSMTGETWGADSGKAPKSLQKVLHLACVSNNSVIDIIYTISAPFLGLLSSASCYVTGTTTAAQTRVISVRSFSVFDLLE